MGCCRALDGTQSALVDRCMMHGHKTKHCGSLHRTDARVNADADIHDSDCFVLDRAVRPSHAPIVVAIVDSIGERAQRKNRQMYRSPNNVGKLLICECLPAGVWCIVHYSGEVFRDGSRAADVHHAPNGGV